MGYASPMGHMPYPVNNLGLRQPTIEYCPQEGAMHLPVSIQHPFLVNNTSWSQAPRQLGVYSPEQLQQARSIAHFSPGVKVETYCNQSVVEQHCPSLSCSTEYPAIDQRFQIQNYEIQGQTESEKRSVQYLRQAAMQNTEQTVLPKSLYFSQSSSWAEFYRKFLNYARDKQWSSLECKTYMGKVLEGKAAEHFQFLIEQDPNLPYYDILIRMEDFMNKLYSQGVMSPVKPCPSKTLTDTQVHSTPSYMPTYKHHSPSLNIVQEPHFNLSNESVNWEEKYGDNENSQRLNCENSSLSTQSIDMDIVSNVDNVCRMKYQTESKDNLTYKKAEECKPRKRQRYVRYRGPRTSDQADADSTLKSEDQARLCDRMTCLETMLGHITTLVDSKQFQSETQDSSALHDTWTTASHDQQLPSSQHAQNSHAFHELHAPLPSTLSTEMEGPGSSENGHLKLERSSETRGSNQEAGHRIRSLEEHADWLDGLCDWPLFTSTPKEKPSRVLPECKNWSDEEDDGESSSLQLLFSETSKAEMPVSPASTASGAHASQQGSWEGPCYVVTDIQESNSEKQEFWWDSLETRGIRAEDEADSLASCEQFIDGMYNKLFGDSSPVNTCTCEEHETWLDHKFADTFHSASLQESCLKDNEVRETETEEETKSPAAQREQINASLHGVTPIWPIKEGNQSPSLKRNQSQDSEEEDSDTSFGTVSICEQQTLSSTLKVPVTVQGVALNAIIDTAAMVTVISDKLYKEIAVKPESLKTAILKTAGRDQKINGQVIGPVSLKLGESTYSVLVLVAPIYENMLLGLNFLMEHCLEINVTEQYLLVRQNNERIPLEISPREGCAVSKVTIEPVECIQDSPTTLAKHVSLQERAACSVHQSESDKKNSFRLQGLQQDSNIQANTQQTGSYDPRATGRWLLIKQMGSLDPRQSNLQNIDHKKVLRLSYTFHAHIVEIKTLIAKTLKLKFVSKYSCQHLSDMEPQKSPVQWISEDDVAWPWDPGGRLLENN